MNPDEVGRKDDQGKLRYDLLPVESIRELVKVLTFGSKKYAPNNWQKVESPKERYTAAAMRHLEAWRGGETYDEESKIHHLAHAMCCLVFLLWFEMRGEIMSKHNDKNSMCHMCGKDPGIGWYVFDEKIWCEKCWCSGPGANWRARKTIVRAQDLGTEVAVYWQLPAAGKR